MNNLINELQKDVMGGFTVFVTIQGYNGNLKVDIENVVDFGDDFLKIRNGSRSVMTIPAGSILFFEKVW